MDYQAAKDLVFLGLRMDALEKEMKRMGQLTEAAIGELTGAVSEVEQEITALKNEIETGQASDADVANRLGGLATRLRQANPDTPTEPTEPTDLGTDSGTDETVDDGTASTDGSDNV
jgi:hypothetical protein